MRSCGPPIALGALVAAILLHSACAPNESVRAAVEVFAGAALALESGDLVAVNGSYGAGCLNRTGDWSVNVDGGEPVDGPRLSVLMNDTACALTLTELRTSAGRLAATPAFVLTDSYRPAASAFGSMPNEFHANARLNTDTFSEDFVLTVLYSESTLDARDVIAQLAPPMVVEETPPDASTNRSIATKPSARFDAPMDAATLTGATFTLEQGAMPIAGTVTFDVDSNTATFSPTALLGLLLTYTATITTGATDTRSTGLAADYVWTFTTAQFSEGPVDLGTAGAYSVLSSAALTNTGMTSVTGKVGSGTSITGFPPGTTDTPPVHVADSDATAALADLSTAYFEVQGRIPVMGNGVTGDIGGTTMTPGLYTAATTLAISGDLTLDAQNDPAAIFVFQIGTTLNTAASARVLLINGTTAANVYWQVGTSAGLGANTAFQGTLMADQSVTLGASATVVGRVLAPRWSPRTQTRSPGRNPSPAPRSAQARAAPCHQQ